MKKLKSRKLWMSIAGLVVMLIIFFGGNPETATQVSAIIVAGGCIVAYVLGQAWCDREEMKKSEPGEHW